MHLFQTQYIGKNHLHFQEIDSTSVYLSNLLSKTNPPEGMCITADFQSAGKGQIGRSWHSEPGMNLLATFLLYPKKLQVEDQFQLSIVISLAVASLVKEVCNPCSIKWPNDIYLGDRKVAGILIQNHLRGAQITSTIVGIGLNVNQMTFPESLPNPVSLAQCSKKYFPLEEIREGMSFWIEQYYEQWKAGQMTELKKEYLHLLYRGVGSHTFQEMASGEVFSAAIDHVTEQGWLVLRRKDGTHRQYGVKEIAFLPD